MTLVIEEISPGPPGVRVHYRRAGKAVETRRKLRAQAEVWPMSWDAGKTFFVPVPPTRGESRTCSVDAHLSRLDAFPKIVGIMACPKKVAPTVSGTRPIARYFPPE